MKDSSHNQIRQAKQKWLLHTLRHVPTVLGSGTSKIPAIDLLFRIYGFETTDGSSELQPIPNDEHSHYLSFAGFNKLNISQKIDFDVENKLNALAVEKASILQELRDTNTANKPSSRAKQTSV